MNLMINTYTCSVHLLRPASPGLEKKSRDFCGRDDLFLTIHRFLVKNKTSADVMTFFFDICGRDDLFFALY